MKSEPHMFHIIASKGLITNIRFPISLRDKLS